MNFRAKFMTGVVLSLFSAFASAATTHFVCCANNASARFYYADNCSEFSYTPSNACTVQLCDKDVNNCIGSTPAASVVVTSTVASANSHQMKKKKVIARKEVQMQRP